ncbi:hypothetical protein CAPTEDRAFT_149156 [Capitella teleta]|uniref:Testicular haploid expressed gene protein-like n=1 Tax=Capitella teleta TaxID=283909 RepID=R7U0C2_CAPTE|nr:hypothetical protein CAPTEDRAFT_149156 [Capitella teleta]|eukprot:ELT96655.1 hypothetical protein CAPTEDRAFT_149156 [Capitella teleta]
MKRPYDENRMAELAQHRNLRSMWITEEGQKAEWRNQDSLWPVRRAAMKHDPSARLVTLAQPKRNFQQGERLSMPEFTYSCGRSSQLWRMNPAALIAEATPRIEQLSQHKTPMKEFVEKADRDHYVFSCGRSSPLWDVNREAKSAEATGRIESLSKHKENPKSFLPSRTVHTIIPKAALRARSTERIDMLSTARSRDDFPHRDPQWKVTNGAKASTPSTRTTELAKFKGLPDTYQPPREVMRPVTWSARNAACSTRLEEMSRPVMRASMDLVQFNPNAFEVKENALKARCTNRLLELSEPLRR